jgi:non-heme chloroperoxidase
LATIGEVNSRGCLWPSDKLIGIALQRLLIVACLSIVAGACGVTPITRREFQTSDGITLSLLEAGQRHARENTLQIAFIPGWSMPASLWQPQLEYLGKSYHVLALDPRGQGQSAVPAGGYTAERRATDLQEFLQPLSHVLLVGWSLGALETLQYVQMFGTSRLAGLVLVDSSVGEEPAPPPGGTFKRRLREEREKMLEEFVRAIFAKPQPEPQIRALIQGAKRMGLEDSLALLSYPFERTHWRQIARGFDKPLLYIVTPQFAEQAESLQKNRPATHVEVFTGAGHALFVDEPERFNALIDAFAKSLSHQRVP